MSDEVVRAVLRAMAWERAKAELKSILHGFNDEYERFQKMEKATKDFIEEVEGWALYE